MNKRALIVDDDPAALRLLEHFLKSNGYEVLQAVNGRDALRVVLEEAPPIIITDWSMPEMNGIELCQSLREHEGVRFAYVLLVTAHSDTERLVEAFDAGADDYLAKPFNRQELLARLRAGERIVRLEEGLARRTREIHSLNAAAALANQKLEEANTRLRIMATTDELTGVLNRREAMNRLRELWAQKDRHGQIFSCIMLDIDHFKKVNDTYGHAAGDTILKETGAVIRKTVRVSDIVCRVGGEEFLIICPQVGLDGAMICAEHVRAAVEANDCVCGGKQLKVTVSLGVAETSGTTRDIDELLRMADEALYQSKEAGRNRATSSSVATTTKSPATPALAASPA